MSHVFSECFNTTQTVFANTTFQPNCSMVYEDGAPKEYPQLVAIIQNAVYSILLVLTLSGNSLVLYCIFEIKRLHTITGLFLMNLAITDLGVGIISIPVTLISANRPNLVKIQWFCDVNGISMVIFLLSSLLTLASLSVQKYMTVGYRMQSRFTKKIAKRVLVAIWVISSGFAFGPVVGWSYYATSKDGHQCGPFAWTVAGRIYSACILTTGMIIPLTAMGYCYFRLYRKMRNHIGRMRTSTVLSGNELADRRATLQESRMVHTLIIIGAVFVTCWSPSAILVALEFAKVEEPLEFEVFALMLAYGNSAMNPLIYALRHEDFRRGFANTFRRAVGMYRNSRIRSSVVGESVQRSTITQGENLEGIVTNGIV